MKSPAMNSGSHTAPTRLVRRGSPWNPKSEIRNPKSETNPNTKKEKFKTRRRHMVSLIAFLIFEFVSDFGFRISDLFRATVFPACILLVLVPSVRAQLSRALAAPSQSAISNSQSSIFNSLPPQQLFGGSVRLITTQWHNPGASALNLNFRARLYQASSSTVALVSDAPWKLLTILPGQTVIESASISLPEVRAETRFFVRWTADSNRVVGSTELLVYPTNLLQELGAIAGDQPIGVFDPRNELAPLLGRFGLSFDDLAETGIADFDGKLAIIARGCSQPEAALRPSVKAAARRGAAVVWIQPAPAAGRPLRPSFCLWREGKGMIVLAQECLVLDLADNPQSQMNLVQLARLAAGQAGTTCPAITEWREVPLCGRPRGIPALGQSGGIHRGPYASRSLDCCPKVAGQFISAFDF